MAIKMRKGHPALAIYWFLYQRTMTTNHRPTLEAKRGKSQSIRDTISHSRALPQQTQLKYRSDISIEEGTRAVEELKAELSGNKRIATESLVPLKRRKEDEVIIPKETKELITASSRGDDEAESDSEVPSESESGSSSSYDSQSDSDSDDEDETAALIKELQNIRKEREIKKKEEEAKITKDAVLTGNPLLNIASPSTNSTGVKKSWRNSTAFNSKSSAMNETAKNDDEAYTNNSLKSDTHKKFMSKYIR
ncbi:pre-mRNA-splicing factor Cwc15p [[Candida] railenensis]|uniref:Pre-mRNA-splicing factor CWC15 n=1 Tax=[Candida] railenensis TaxID=45579 RepID=A0A9P0QQR3_9ASCO|nr:pre-mRNA-splicing factor Cwc15p [[Candida] railenensis]